MSKILPRTCDVLSYRLHVRLLINIYYLVASLPKVYNTYIMSTYREPVCVHNVRRYILCIPLSWYGRRSCDCNKSNLVGFEDHTKSYGDGGRGAGGDREKKFSLSPPPVIFAFIFSPCSYTTYVLNPPPSR